MMRPEKDRGLIHCQELADCGWMGSSGGVSSTTHSLI